MFPAQGYRVLIRDSNWNTILDLVQIEEEKNLALKGWREVIHLWGNGGRFTWAALAWRAKKKLHERAKNLLKLLNEKADGVEFNLESNSSSERDSLNIRGYRGLAWARACTKYFDLSVGLRCDAFWSLASPNMFYFVLVAYKSSSNSNTFCTWDRFMIIIRTIYFWLHFIPNASLRLQIVE